MATRPDASPVVTPDDPRLAGMGKDRMALPTLRLLIEKIKERET